MRPRQQLHSGFERLIGTALVDTTVRRSLLQDPQQAALEFGLSATDAAVVADIRATDIRTFAQTLIPRLYSEAVHATRPRSIAG